MSLSLKPIEEPPREELLAETGIFKNENEEFPPIWPKVLKAEAKKIIRMFTFNLFVENAITSQIQKYCFEYKKSQLFSTITKRFDFVLLDA